MKRQLAGKELFKSIVTQVLVSRNTKNLFDVTTLKNIKQYYATMNEFDDQGHAPIHQSAQRGLIRSIERFVQTNRNQLELETRDHLRCTPLIVAVKFGQLAAVKTLVTLGSRLDCATASGENVIQVAVANEHADIVEYFVTINSPQLKVWPILFKLLSSLSEEEVCAAAGCLKPLLREQQDGSLSIHWAPALQDGLVPAVLAAVANDIDVKAKMAALRLLLHVIRASKVQEELLKQPTGLQVLNRTCSASDCPAAMLRMIANCFVALASDAEQAQHCVKEGSLVVMCRCLQAPLVQVSPDALTEIAEAIGCLVKNNPSHQTSASKEAGTIEHLVTLFRSADGSPCLHKNLLFAMTRTVAALADGHHENQELLVGKGVGPHIIFLCRAKSRDLQHTAIAALRTLATGNATAQRSLLNDGAVLPLVAHLKRARSQENQVVSAAAMWALAGQDAAERRTMATVIGIQSLLDFIQTTTEQLHLIAADALSVLAEGPASQRKRIAEMNGIPALVRLLRSDREQIVACAIRCMRHLCVGVGNTPHAGVQVKVIEARGLKFLVALMVHARSELIQMQAALAAAAVVMGNQVAMESLKANAEFSYICILRCLYSDSSEVRLLAASALAAFAYNCVREQKAIALLGGVKYLNFIEFLRSADEEHRALAAYQTTVLARVIPDEEQAISSARGIKILNDLLASSSTGTQALVSDLIARLAHSRSGIPQAMLSIGVTVGLSELVLSTHESVRGCAAIALAYLSRDHAGRRQILAHCRHDPFIMKSIEFYSKDSLSHEFIEGWDHFRKVGLPPISPGRPQLMMKKTMDMRQEPEPTMVTLIEAATVPMTPISRFRTRRRGSDSEDSDSEDAEPNVDVVHEATVEEEEEAEAEEDADGEAEAAAAMEVEEAPAMSRNSTALYVA